MRPFDQIVTEHGAVVLRVCRAIVGPDHADDAWSETFIAAMRAYPDLPDGSNVVGWLVTIAHNKAIDLVRRNGRAPRPVDTTVEHAAGRAAPASIDPASTRLDEDVRQAIDALAPKQRQAVILRYVADLDYAVVAATMHISPAAARRNAADGIASLRSNRTFGASR